jgi:hypothetical protein
MSRGASRARVGGARRCSQATEQDCDGPLRRPLNARGRASPVDDARYEIAPDVDALPQVASLARLPRPQLGAAAEACAYPVPAPRRGPPSAPQRGGEGLRLAGGPRPDLAGQ